MSEQTKIQWADSTVNFWSGCTKVSPGCANCYAEAMDKRHLVEKKSHWGKGKPRLKSKSAVALALKLNREPWICDSCGKSFSHQQMHECPTVSKVVAFTDEVNWHRRRIFSLSRGDWLDDEVPIEWLAEMLDTMRRCDQVIWILCTKQPENFTTRLYAVIRWCENEAAFGKMPHEKLHALADFVMAWIDGNASANIIILTSIENQERADNRIPELLKIPAVCRGLSLEPLLGEVDLQNLRAGTCGIVNYDCLHGSSFSGSHKNSKEKKIDWLIIGGESGPGARPCNLEWIQSLIEQGKAAGVATFVKQLGALPVCSNANLFGWHDDEMLASYGEGAASCRLMTRHPKGGDPAEWPDGFNVQQWPKL